MHRSHYECFPNPDGTRGWIWNPITGSLGDCPNPNARKLANTRLKERYLANENLAGGYRLARGVYKEGAIPPKYDPFYPRFWDDKLQQPVVKYKSTKAGYIWKPHKAKGVFCCDMSDLFGIGIPEEWTRQVLNVIDYCCQDRFYLLTKQPQNLAKFSPFPENCFVGQTLTNQDDADRTFNDFAKVEATVKYVSLEPLLGRVDISPYLKGWVNAGTIFENPEGVERYDVDWALVNHIDWVIIGACTGPRKDMEALIEQHPGLTLMPYGKKWTAQPKIEWVQEIVEACDKAGVKVFLKNNLEELLYKADAEWAFDADGALRQEKPSG
ncbi:hypothetical protein LCGC14_1574940 [marine sediment metagenome]|uniref:Uncharacterized protein n=1 Tax=marine sediment metagenome TaxID=412755 RepID=A0A0F9LIY0_9ZZZZ